MPLINASNSILLGRRYSFYYLLSTSIINTMKKGYYRKGKALHAMKQFMESYEVFDKGVRVCKSTNVLATGRSEALEAYHKLSKSMYGARQNSLNRTDA